MAKIADIVDPTLRALLEEVDRLIGDGKYVEASRKCVDTYLAVVAKRPDFIPPPMAGLVVPQGRKDIPPNPSRGFGGGSSNIALQRQLAWPNNGGIRINFDEQNRPSVSYEKERFSFSEAASYFEFTMDTVIRAQRTS